MILGPFYRSILSLTIVCCGKPLSFSTGHLPGRLNTAADSLSQNNMSLFMQLVPEDTASNPPLYLRSCCRCWSIKCSTGLHRAGRVLHSICTGSSRLVCAHPPVGSDKIQEVLRQEQHVPHHSIRIGPVELCGPPGRQTLGLCYLQINVGLTDLF